jgi:hypothetical protein
LGEQEKKTDIKQNTADKMRALFTSKDEQKRRKEEQSLQTKQSHSVDESRMQQFLSKMRTLFTSKDEQKRRKEEQSLQTKQSHSVDESRMQQSLSKMRTLFLIPEVRDQYLQEFAKRKQ